MITSVLWLYFSEESATLTPQSEAKLQQWRLEDEEVAAELVGFDVKRFDCSAGQ